MKKEMITDLTVGSRAIDAYSRLSYTMWYALAEFVDNSTQSLLNYEGLITDAFKEEGTTLQVSIVHDRLNKKLTIEDNSIGMNYEALINALKIANPTKDSRGRSKYGMGMKTAACWIGSYWEVTTCELGSGEEWTAKIDVNGIANESARVPLSLNIVSNDKHYTRITITGLRRVIQKRTEETIKDYLGSMYMFDLRKNNDGNVGLKLTYNGEEVKPPEENEWDTDPSGMVMKRELKKITIDGKEVSGWIGVLRKGGRKYGGFSLFQNSRQIQGFPNAWKPSVIFGGVDSEGANNLVAQRLTGVLLLDGFGVSHTKDKILFENDEEDQLEKYLVEECKDFADYAQRRRGGGEGKGPKWTRDQVRDLVKDMHDEFVSPEIQDALNNASLPPIEVLTSNNIQQVKSLTTEDEIGQITVLNDLKVIISLKETSSYEPHVTFSPGASSDVIHVIINGLHPYYQTLESKDQIHECIQQYIYDAVAEFKASRLVSRVNPDSVRSLKNNLLAAKAHQMDNADFDVRTNEQSELFKDEG